MLKITKTERDKLLKTGCVYGKDIHKTYSHYSNYYLTESKKNLEKVNKIRGLIPGGN